MPPSRAATVTAMFQRLTRYGSSIELSWTEDDNMWSCAWITGGKRFTALGSLPEQAMMDVWLMAASSQIGEGE